MADPLLYDEEHGPPAAWLNIMYDVGQPHDEVHHGIH